MCVSLFISRDIYRDGWKVSESGRSSCWVEIAFKSWEIFVYSWLLRRLHRRFVGILASESQQNNRHSRNSWHWEEFAVSSHIKVASWRPDPIWTDDAVILLPGSSWQDPALPPRELLDATIPLFADLETGDAPTEHAGISLIFRSACFKDVTKNGWQSAAHMVCWRASQLLPLTAVWEQIRKGRGAARLWPLKERF